MQASRGGLDGLLDLCRSPRARAELEAAQRSGRHAAMLRLRAPELARAAALRALGAVDRAALLAIADSVQPSPAPARARCLALRDALLELVWLGYGAPSRAGVESWLDRAAEGLALLDRVRHPEVAAVLAQSALQNLRFAIELAELEQRAKHCRGDRSPGGAEVGA